MTYFQNALHNSIGVFCAFATALIASTTAHADSAPLTGSWSGSGSFSLVSGKTEKARCNARYAKTGGNSYSMAASCATSSAKVDQTAELVKTGANRYSGRFFNAQYNTGGSISVTVSGSSQSVRLSGEAGAGSFNLRKR